MQTIILLFLAVCLAVSITGMVNAARGLGRSVSKRLWHLAFSLGVALLAASGVAYLFARYPVEYMVQPTWSAIGAGLLVLAAVYRWSRRRSSAAAIAREKARSVQPVALPEEAAPSQQRKVFCALPSRRTWLFRTVEPSHKARLQHVLDHIQECFPEDRGRVMSAKLILDRKTAHATIDPIDAAIEGRLQSWTRDAENLFFQLNLEPSRSNLAKIDELLDALDGISLNAHFRGKEQRQEDVEAFTRRMRHIGADVRQ